MAFVDPITIREAIDSIHRKEFLLPAIQREFVWYPYQIERLFDSLMRGYPISSFLFWNVDKSKVNTYQFYEFIREYHEKDKRHNPKASLNGEEAITAILDGQQRLTSLYIGLRGTYAYKLPRKRWDNPDAFPKRKLCLNLLSPSPDSDLEYDFQFLTKGEHEDNDHDHHWFPVCNILDMKEQYEVNQYLIKKCLFNIDAEKGLFANKALFRLHQVIHIDKSINFFLEKDESLDKVLNIFIRVNSGGTQLNYSDLLLSIATAQWKHKDAREEITAFVDDVNAIGDGFNINKDFVLKSCLILGGFKEIAFKVDNFNQKNMLQIEEEWESIAQAIKDAVLLVSSLGYHRDTLTSNTALIPIAHYLRKIGCPHNFAESSKYLNDRKKILKWLATVLLKRTFSGQPDNVLRPMREVLNSNLNNGFPHDEMVIKLKGHQKALTFDTDEIDNFLYYEYAQPYTYSVLALLYPSLDFRNKFHQDHIFPKKLFTKRRLERREIDSKSIDFYLENFNCLANLQLLEGIPNQEKSGKDFDQWLVETYPNKNDRKAFMERHYIPDVDLSLENFQEFIEERQKLLIKAVNKLLA